MRPALLLFCYALVIAWCLPPWLARLTASGVSARLGLAGWLGAMGSALAAAVVAILFYSERSVPTGPALLARCAVRWRAARVPRSCTAAPCTS